MAEEEIMQRTEGETSGEAITLKSRPDPFLVICGCFSFITIAAVLSCITVNVLSAVRSFKNGSDIFDGIFRCYAVIIGLLAVAAETEWSFIINYWKVLEYWVGRGMLQIFVAVMTKAYPGDFENHKDIILLQSIASYMLLSCGVIYIVSGLLCIGHFKRARQKKEVNRDQAVKDLQDLERRREELQALLLMDERV